MHSCHSSLLANRIKCKQKGKKKISVQPTQVEELCFWFCQPQGTTATFGKEKKSNDETYKKVN